MDSLGSMKITNKTKFPLEIQLAQLLPLYYDLVPPNSVFYRETGAVHFTINGRINTTGQSDTVTKEILPITTALSRGILAIFECAIMVGEVNVTTSSPISQIGIIPKIVHAMAEAVSTGAAILLGRDRFSWPGWYAGYKHDLEIHYENDVWKIKDVKYNSCIEI